MARKRSRSTGRKIISIVGVIVLVAAVLVGINRWLSGPEGGPELPGPPTTETSEAEQPADCPAAEVIVAPGTWESSVDEDPLNPTLFPASMLLNVSRPLQEKVDPARLKVWTANYPAQFRNMNSMGEMTYDESRQDGVNRVNAELTATHDHCPKTGFLLVGFSQGAVLLGDIVSDIGNNRGVIPDSNVWGATLVADGRRSAGVGQTVGYQPTGVGAEIALQPLAALLAPVVPGATMRGTRPGGFGSLQNVTNEICAKGDQVCDAPVNVSDGLASVQSMLNKNAIHAQYATNPDVIEGTTVPDWTVGWVMGAMDQHQ